MFKVTLGVGEANRVRTHRLSKWVPMLLTLVGSLALASGLFVAVLTVTRTPAKHDGVGLTARGAVYVGGGGDTCFTCHSENDPVWSIASQPVPASHPATGAASGLVEVSARVQAPRIGGEPITNVQVIGTSSDTVMPYYVIATENDSPSVSSQSQPGIQASPGNEARCAECHSKAHTSDALRLQRAEGACIICHTNTRQVSRRAAHPAGSQWG